MAQQFSPVPFIAKWSRAELSERAARHEHFIDLCRLPGQPIPPEHDATGVEYTFEKGVTPTGGASHRATGAAGRLYRLDDGQPARRCILPARREFSKMTIVT